MQHNHIVDPSLSRSYPSLGGITPEKLDNLKAFVESGTSRGQLRNFLKSKCTVVKQVNLILSVYKFDFILPLSLNLCFTIDLVLS